MFDLIALRSLSTNASVKLIAVLFGEATPPVKATVLDVLAALPSLNSRGSSVSTSTVSLNGNGIDPELSAIAKLFSTGGTLSAV